LESNSKLSTAEWILDPAFLVEQTSFLNKLNMKLQGKGKLLPGVFSDIKAFKMKLKLINKHVKSKTWPISFPVKAFS
jgi:hypothetical protein